MKIALGAALAATLALAAPAAAQGAKSVGAPPVVQKEFGAFLTRFRAALKANDAAAVAGMTRLPFPHDGAARDAAQFQARVYPALFTRQNRACLQRERGVYDRDPQNNKSYFLFCGDVIFIFTKTPAGFRFADVGVND